MWLYTRRAVDPMNEIWRNRRHLIDFCLFTSSSSLYTSTPDSLWSLLISMVWSLPYLWWYETNQFLHYLLSFHTGRRAVGRYGLRVRVLLSSVLKLLWCAFFCSEKYDGNGLVACETFFLICSYASAQNTVIHLGISWLGIFFAGRWRSCLAAVTGSVEGLLRAKNDSKVNTI